MRARPAWRSRRALPIPALRRRCPGLRPTCWMSAGLTVWAHGIPASRCGRGPKPRSWPLPLSRAPTLDGSPRPCCRRAAYEFVPGEPDELHDASLRLILDHCSPQVEALLAQSAQRLDLGLEDAEPSVEEIQDAMPAILEHLGPPWSSVPRLNLRFVVDAMWTLPGEQGVEWMRRLLRCASDQGRLPATCQLRLPAPADLVAAGMDAFASTRSARRRRSTTRSSGWSSTRTIRRHRRQRRR